MFPEVFFKNCWNTHASLSPVGFGAFLIHIWRGVPRVLPKVEPSSIPRVLPKVELSSVPRVVPGRYGFRYGEGALAVL